MKVVLFKLAANIEKAIFTRWSTQKIWFVTCMKANAVFHVTKVLVEKAKKKNAKGVVKEQYITVAVKQKGTLIPRLTLRRITVKSDGKQEYTFITNNFTLPATQIATIYKNRWMIELLFKQIKQNFPLRYFWGESPQRDKDASLLCFDSPIADGGNTQKGCNKKIICKYDNGHQVAPHE